MATEPDEWEATCSGTWPDGTDFAAGDRVKALPVAEERWLRARKIFVPVKPAAPAHSPTNKAAPSAESHTSKEAADGAE